MSDAARTHTDGFLLFGSQDVTIFAKGATTNGVAYTAESFSLDRDTNVIEGKNAKGVVYRDAMIETPLTGSLTLLILEEGDKAPAIASHFLVVPIGGDPEDDAIAVKVKKVGEAFTQEGETKVTIEVREKFTE